MSENNFWDDVKHLKKPNKLQKYYDKLIKYANLAFVQSEDKKFAVIQMELLVKAESFEAAADLFWSNFQDDIIPTTTIRFNSIREHHLEENTDEPKVIIES